MDRLLNILFPERRELPYAVYIVRVKEQIRASLPYAGLLALVSWLPYLYIDGQIHPEMQSALGALRLGLSLCGALALVARYTEFLGRFDMAAYYITATYLLQATPIVTVLTHNDPQYVAGYQLALLVVSLFPLRFHLGLMQITGSLVTYHVFTYYYDREFFIRSTYLWSNLAISFFVSMVIQYANERRRLKTEAHRRKLEETRFALKRRTEQIENDMSIARLVQSNLMPHSFPDSHFIEIHGFYQSMELIGGDFYDVYVLDDHRQLLFIADASGHGVSAALVAGMAKISFYHALDAGCSHPSDLLQFMNKEIKRFLRTEHFLTGFALLADSHTGVVEYSNAGHRPPVYVRADGTMEHLDTPGTILGVLEDAGYETQSIPMRSGDFVALYTDGIIESRNRKGEEFGPERLVGAVQKYRKEAISRVPFFIFSDLRVFSDGVVPGDDLTLLVARIK